MASGYAQTFHSIEVFCLKRKPRWENLHHMWYAITVPLKLCSVSTRLNPTASDGAEASQRKKCSKTLKMPHATLNNNYWINWDILHNPNANWFKLCCAHNTVSAHLAFTFRFFSSVKQHVTQSFCGDESTRKVSCSCKPCSPIMTLHYFCKKIFFKKMNKTFLPSMSNTTEPSNFLRGLLLLLQVHCFLNGTYCMCW